MRQQEQGEQELFGQLASIGSVEVGLFEVTATQLEKSIVDANFLIRTGFAATGFHDYLEQPKGQEYKVEVGVSLLTASGLREAKLSLYRPSTKAGDPRLWIQKLPSLYPETKAGDLIALVQDGAICAVSNLTDRVRTGNGVEEVKELFDRAAPVVSGIASELLLKLENLAASGAFPAVSSGDNAVGLAVEAALGIKPNSRRIPDYKGIEIKSGHSVSGNANKTLFAKMFDKERSPTKSYAGLLAKCGYLKDDGLKYLQCSVTGNAPNPQGLKLSVDLAEGLLNEHWDGPSGAERVAVWKLVELEAALSEKHNTTFWVEANKVTLSSGKGFQLGKVLHTSSPKLSAFSHFLADGTVFVDHTIRQKPEGGTRDHGMLFRTKALNLPRLFKVEGEYSLA